MSENIEVKVYEGDTLIEGVNLAIKNRLYVSGWTLRSDLGTFKREKEWATKGRKISLAFKDGKPVGICLKHSYGFAHTFVRKSERRKGIGKELVSKVSDGLLYGYEGLKNGQTQKFFKSAGIQYRD